MEYYIYKVYKNKQEEDESLKLGLDIYDSKEKKRLIFCFIIGIVAIIEMIATMILFPRRAWSLLGILIFAIDMLAILHIDNKYQKNHMDKFTNFQKNKLEILEKVLFEYNINNRTKIEELIAIYQEYIDKKTQETKRFQKIFTLLLSAAAGVLTISFENMRTIEMDFLTWVYFSEILLSFTAIIGFVMFFNMKFDPIKKYYQIMIKDLKELLLIKY